MTILEKINHSIISMYNLKGPYDAILLTDEHNKTIDEDIIKTKAFYCQITQEFIFVKI